MTTELHEELAGLPKLPEDIGDCVVREPGGIVKYAILYRTEDYAIEFCVYEVEQPEPDKPVFLFEDENCQMNPTIPETPFAHGYLKWNGCVNISFGDTYHHFCGPEKDPALGRIMRSIYSLGEQMENWSTRR